MLAPARLEGCVMHMAVRRPGSARLFPDGSQSQYDRAFPEKPDRQSGCGFKNEGEFAVSHGEIWKMTGRKPNRAGRSLG
jgi:hypothetical protein